MLGWFKKKFGRKKKAEPEVVEVVQEVEVEESVVPEAPPVVETPEVERDEFPAVEQDIPEEDAKSVEEQATFPPAAPEDEQELPAEQVEVGADVVVQSEAEEEPKPVDAQPETAEENVPASEVEVDQQVSEELVEAPVIDEPQSELDTASEPEDVVVDGGEEASETTTSLESAEKEVDGATAVETAVTEEVEPVQAVSVVEAASPPEAEEPVEDVDETLLEDAEVAEDAEVTGVEEKPLDGDEERAGEEAAKEQEKEVEAEPVAPVQKKASSPSLFKRLHQRLGKTRDSFVHRIDTLFLGRKEIDQKLFDDLEEILITADLGVETTMDLLEHARKTVKRDQLSDPRSLKKVLRDRIYTYIESADQAAELVMPDKGPFVIMVIGVNGVGKTTTIGKIANKFVASGQSVLLVAGDTFRAAAIDQLKIWGSRVGVEVVAQQPGTDPSSVVFDGMEYGIAHKFDVIIIDTAGRLHTSVNLMQELKKIKRVIGKKMPKAPHEVMLVLDATTGQNGLSQAKLFDAAVDVTGLAMSKLDGTAKGGIVATICREMKIPVRFIGIGEQMDDLRDFDSREFVDALFADQDEE